MHVYDIREYLNLWILKFMKIGMHACKVHELMRNSDSSRKTVQGSLSDAQKDLLGVEFRAYMSARMHESSTETLIRP